MPVLANDPAVLHLQTSVADSGQFLAVRGNEKGMAEIVPQLPEQLVHFLGILAIQISGRFIGEDHLGAIEQCPGHGYTLLLPTG